MKKYTVIGLTGQTGSGKTTVCRVFREEGFYIIDCDIVARDVTADGSQCCKELAEHFPSCFDDSLHLDRRQLGSIVFADSEKLSLLNSVIFPFIDREIDRRILAAAGDGERFILLDAPTLFEAGADSFCDTIAACVSKKQKRIDRIMRRDGIDRTAAKDRIASQHDEEFFRERAEYIIENNGTLSEVRELALACARKIKEQYGGKEKYPEESGS